jgi:hypothetical protein
MTDTHETQWRVLLENPAAISSIFGETDPDLSNARLLGISISEGGSLLTLNLAVNQVPARQPTRRMTNSANATSIELQCLALEEASIAARPGDSSVSCEIAKQHEAGRMIRIIGASTEVVIRCGFLRVNHIVPYTANYSPKTM